MTTELTTQKLPAPTPQIAKELSPQQLSEHREKIYSEVKVVLSAYFQPHEAEDIKAAQLAWWCDEMQDWTHEQVVYARRKWNRDKPRLRPTPGDIVALLKRLRGQREAERMQPSQAQAEPQKERVSAERAAEILAEAGFAPKKMETDG